MGVSYYFMSDLEWQLMQLYEKEKSRRTFYRRELKQLPEGKLVIRQQESGRLYLYEKRNGVARNHQTARTRRMAGAENVSAKVSGFRGAGVQGAG